MFSVPYLNPQMNRKTQGPHVMSLLPAISFLGEHGIIAERGQGRKSFTVCNTEESAQTQTVPVQGRDCWASVDLAG